MILYPDLTPHLVELVTDDGDVVPVVLLADHAADAIDLAQTVAREKFGGWEPDHVLVTPIPEAMFDRFVREVKAAAVKPARPRKQPAAVVA